MNNAAVLHNVMAIGKCTDCETLHEGQLAIGLFRHPEGQLILCIGVKVDGKTHSLSSISMERVFSLGVETP